MATSKNVKRTMPTGTGCDRTADWSHASQPDGSAPLEGETAQITSDARTIGESPNQRTQYASRSTRERFGAALSAAAGTELTATGAARSPAGARAAAPLVDAAACGLSTP